MSEVKKSKIGFRVITMVLMLGIFVFGALTGVFVHATGENVLSETWMQMISHTEYRYGEQGQIIARLVNFQGNAVSVDNCTATILYPDKTSFVSGDLMSASGISGDHYYNFTTPTGPEGVYEYQATCYYTLGSNILNKSVTNSFHLSGAFNDVLNNLTQLSTDLFAVNDSLSSEINQVASSVSQLSTDMDNNFTAISNQLNSNVSTILDAIDTINVNVNFTPVFDAIDALNDSTQSSFSIVINNQQELNATLNTLNTTINEMELVLNNINTTTTNTYQYITGTLTTSINDILVDLGVINATVNRIELNTVEINTTVSQILTNQEDEVFMTVFSG